MWAWHMTGGAPPSASDALSFLDLNRYPFTASLVWRIFLLPAGPIRNFDLLYLSAVSVLRFTRIQKYKGTLQ